MKQYQELLQDILKKGIEKTDRTGTGTLSLFAPQLRFNLSEGFPLVTTKKVHYKSIIHELLWMLKGETNLKYLHENGVKIWDEWATAEGDLGPVYGHQWRSWGAGVGSDHQPGIDQIQQLIDTLKSTPDSRRMVVSAWNVADLPKMALSPCHCLFQFYTVPLNQIQRYLYACNENSLLPASDQEHLGNTPRSTLDAALDSLDIPCFRLDCQLYQRSADVFLGVPFNIAAYALLTQMVAQVVNMVPGEFIWTGGDTHLYLNHLEQAREQLTRTPHPLPSMHLNPAVTDLFSFKYADFTLKNYAPHPAIKANVSV